MIGHRIRNPIFPFFGNTRIPKKPWTILSKENPLNIAFVIISPTLDTVENRSIPLVGFKPASWARTWDRGSGFVVTVPASTIGRGRSNAGMSQL
ncbi:MAG: hypothetical protein STSR0009_13010 [Methanoregula sp.]